MKSSFKNFNRWLAAFGVAAFLMVAGWHFGLSSTDAVFSDTELALENAVAGSDCMTFTFRIVDWDPLACQSPAGLCTLITCD